MPSETTPLMKQYFDLKAQVGDALLFYRMGDFYELFDHDAIEASKLLEITLTSRDKNKSNPTPMAGVPFHSAQSYIQRLLDLGRKVAIAEQVVETIAGKEFIRRELTRVLTPAIQFENEKSEPHYLGTLIGSSCAVLDASTGEVRSGTFANQADAITCLSALPIRHFLWIGEEPAPAELKKQLDAAQTLVETLPSNRLRSEQALELLRAQYGVSSIASWTTHADEVLSIALLVQTVLKTQRLERLPSLRLPRPLIEASSLKLGPQSARHLDLLPNEQNQPSLYHFLNRCKTSLGARALRQWILEPLRAPAAISERQHALRAFASSPLSLEKTRACLSEVYDIERILGRVHTRLANPRDTQSLGQSLKAAHECVAQLESLLIEQSTRAQASKLVALKTMLSEADSKLRPLWSRILTTQNAEAPFHDREGGIFKRGTDAELDRLIDLSENGQRWLLDLEARERGRTGIPSLKVRYNRVFGYYIEVTTAHLKNVPTDYQRKQTMVGAERFFTDELKKFEEEILTASSKQKSLEQKLFQDLLASIRENTAEIQRVAQAIAEIDALSALALLCSEPGWTFPSIDDSRRLEIRAGRHPVVDAAMRGAFVPNDTLCDASQDAILLITGPNMGGKSTLMRQVALIVILGQMGAPVPAQSARWGSFSSLFTRIGAHDAIAQGQSTFMVEMTELSHILHAADDRSLIVLDEIGRGTSTYDGISVAWAAIEYLHDKVGARTLFATHYHELTALPAKLKRVKNLRMAVEGGRDARQPFRFLFKLEDGPASESFGIIVAKLAGLPKTVIERAWKVLDQLEASAATRPSDAASSQLSLFGLRTELKSNSAEIIERVLDWDLNRITPIDALARLSALQEELRAESLKSGAVSGSPIASS